MVTTVPSLEQQLDTGIANLGLVMSEPTPTPLAPEQSDDTPSPQEMAEAQRAMNKLLSERAELEAAMGDPSMSAEQKANLQQAQQRVSSSIGGLNTAINSKSRTGITAALASAGVIINTANGAESKATSSENLSGAAYHSGGQYDYSSDMRAANYSQLSASSKANYDALSELNIGNFNSYSELTRTQLAVATNKNLGVQDKIDMNVQQAIERSPEMKAQQQAQVQKAETTLDEALAFAKANGHDELAAALEERKQLAAKFGTGAKFDLAKEHLVALKEKMQNGTASAQDIQTFTNTVKAENADLEQKHVVAAKETFNRLDDQEKAFLRELNGGKDPSAEKIFEMANKKYDAKAMNDIAWIKKNHPDDYMKYLSKEQKEMWVGAVTQIGYKGRESSIALGEYLQSLTPEQQAEFKTKLLEEYKKDPKLAQAMLDSIAKDKNIPPEKLKAIQDFIKNKDEKGLDLVLNAAMNPNDAAATRQFDVHLQTTAEADLYKLQGKAREEYLASGSYYYAEGYDYRKFSLTAAEAAAMEAALKSEALNPNANTKFTTTSTSPALNELVNPDSTQPASNGVTTQAAPPPPAPSLVVSDTAVKTSDATLTANAPVPSSDPKDLQAALANGGFSQGALVVGSTTTPPEAAQTVAQQQSQSTSSSLSQILANGGFDTVAFQRQLQATPTIIASNQNDVAVPVTPSVAAATANPVHQR